VAIDTTNPAHDDWIRFIAARPDAARLADQPGWALFMLPGQTPGTPPPCTTHRIAVAAASFDDTPIDYSVFTDDESATRWISSGPQRAGNTLVLQLAADAQVCGIELSRAAEGELYPRALEVATSLDGTTWNVAFAGEMGGSALNGVLDDPRHARASVALPAARARFVRLRLLHSDAVYQWAIAEVTVRGTPVNARGTP
jgi:hypothetical protein